MTSPIAKQLAQSIEDEPDRWTEDGGWLERDDSVSLRIIDPYTGGRWNPRLHKPRQLDFGLWDRLMLMRAVRRWRHLPLGETR